MVDQVTIAKIMDAAQIVEVVSDFVTLKKRGVNFIGLCPFHNEKTGSFTVSPSKGIFKCFGCGKGGNAVHFIMEHEQLGYVEALKYLAKKYNIEIQERELSQEEQQLQNDRESLFAVNLFAKKYFENILHNHIDGKSIGLGYFNERGFSGDIIQKFQLGYCLDAKDTMTQEALKNGFKKEFLEKTGLSIFGENGYAADRFRGRVIFPVHTLSGKIVAFGGRILKKDEKTAKYLNSPESEIYHKSNELYGIYFAKQSIVKQARCFLVEGYTDVISMHQSGIENVVASSGTSLTTEQIRIIHRFTENITVLYDGDAAGIKASIRGIDMLLEAGMNVKVVLLPDGEDPDSFAQSHNADEFIRFIDQNQVDFIRFKTNLLLKDSQNDPIKKSQAIREVIQSIAFIQNSIITSEYVKECSEIFNIDEKILYNEINKTKYNRLEKERQEPFKESSTSIANEAATEKQKTSVELLSSPLENEEKDIIYFIVRYGELIVKQQVSENNTTTERTIKIGAYILNDLKNDGISFQHPLHKAFLIELEKHIQEPNFKASTFFVNHQNPNISLLAANLMTDKYQLSKLFTKNPLEEILQKKELSDSELKNMNKQLSEQKKLKQIEFIHWVSESVLRSLFEYKKSLLNIQIKDLENSLKKNPQAENLAEIMKEHARLNQIRRNLANELGQVIF